MKRPLPPMDFEALGGEPRRSEGFRRHTLDPDEDLLWPQPDQRGLIEPPSLSYFITPRLKQKGHSPGTNQSEDL